MTWQYLWTWIRTFDPRHYVATTCGHRTKQVGHTSDQRGNGIMTMSKHDGKIGYCLACIGKMTIRCAWCDQPIVIGDPVTLYSIFDPNYVPKPHAVVYAWEPHAQFVGCLRWNCAEGGADRAGFWVPSEDGKGKVHRVMSPVEAVLRTGQPVMVSDVTDMTEALNLGRSVVK